MAERSFDIYVGETFQRGLKESLQKVLEDYREQREDYFVAKFGATDVEWQAFRTLLDAVAASAQIFLWGSNDLASSESVASANDLLKHFTAAAERGRNVMSLIKEEVLLDLSTYSFESLDGKVERFWKLLSVAETMTPTPPTAEFLRSVSRCYLAGFDSECIVMCRSVLDTAFEAEIGRDECLSELAARIDFACRNRRISYEAAKMAHSIREKGNRGVHRQPVACDDAIVWIKDTLTVLRELC